MAFLRVFLLFPVLVEYNQRLLLMVVIKSAEQAVLAFDGSRWHLTVFAKDVTHEVNVTSAFSALEVVT